MIKSLFEIPYIFVYWSKLGKLPLYQSLNHEFKSAYFWRLTILIA